MGTPLLQKSITLGLLGLVCFLGAIPLATWTEPFLTHPVEQALAWLQSRGLPLHPLDEKGVPRVYYLRLKEAFDNPVYVCIYAYGYYQLWKGSREYDYFLKHYAFSPPGGLGPEEYRECFFACADWLVEHLKSKVADGQRFYVWEYSFPWSVYDLNPPWVSGMAQGCGIEVLVRAYQESKDPRYREAAGKALGAFFVPVEAGGVVRNDAPDAWWYEEYAAPGCKESRVLNGMAHALIGIAAYWELTGDPEAARLFHHGFQSLKRHLPQYDTGQWTYYDQLGQIAKWKYHQINIATIQKLGELTGDPLLAEVAHRWQSYRSNYFVRYFLWQRPLRFYSLLFGLNMLLVAVPSGTLCLLVRKLLAALCRARLAQETTPKEGSRENMYDHQCTSVE